MFAPQMTSPSRSAASATNGSVALVAARLFINDRLAAMRPSLALFAGVLSLVGLLLAASVARADIPAPPERPQWDDPPAPLPDPPDAWRWLLPIGLAAAAGATALRLRGRRPGRSAA